MGHMACRWPPARPCDANHHPLDPDVQTVFGSADCLLTQAEHQQLVCENVVEGSIKILARQYLLLSPCSSIQWYEIFLFFLKIRTRIHAYILCRVKKMGK